MDASNTGLCAIHPAAKEFLRVQFDEDERAMIAASWIPTRTSTLTYIRFWIDNTSAVSWFNSLHSRDPQAQELNRVIGAVESRWRLRVSAAHLPGALNVLADLGSRAWDGDQLIRWNDLTCSWSQVPIPPPLRKIYSSTCSPNSTAPSRTPHIGSISSRGDSGARSALGFTSRLPKGQASASSIRSKLSHVRWYHRIYTSCDPQLTPSHGLVLAGMQRVSVFSKTREPVTLEMLQSIMESLDPRKAHHRVIGGAALLGFFFLLRSA
ncbi:hypothetical protein Pcac1_g22454 [Phytophthora cactorum]|nr:hypothetical protein Pcac1_g22454 [Phytophthora cactorum]KAG3195039.1 hypothetical protein PC128_g8837 [Phytophthora cactorum]